MHRLKNIRDCLLTSVEGQMGHLDCVDAHELGEVVDMVKDMEEAMYYCSITKAMKEKEEEEKENPYRYYGGGRKFVPMPMYPSYEGEMYRDMDKDMGRMYYSDGIHNMGRIGHQEGRDKYPMEIRDAREGKSPISRKNYMESKELHHGTPAQMKELEKYLHELSEDITEMIEDASPEEKAILQQKLTTLAAKIK